jgi:hypothetical protein
MRGDGGNPGNPGNPNNPATCPMNAPRAAVACETANEMCAYTGEECTCERAAGGGGRPGRDAGAAAGDGGFRGVWNCVRTRPDGGGGGGMNMCPATQPMNAETCDPMTAAFCTYGMTRCLCGRARGRDAAATDEWTCQ